MKKFLTVLLALLALCAGACAEVHMGQPPAEGWTEDVLRITAIPVDEGDALLLECGGEVMMVDGGPSARYHRVTEVLEARGITHFKYLLNTHYHDDHIKTNVAATLDTDHLLALPQSPRSSKPSPLHPRK